jgi:predicted MFS family arabinose efflux permease
MNKRTNNRDQETPVPGFFPKAHPDGMLASVLLAFLATAGLFYVNIMPALVAGLVDGLGFTNKQAGLVASANVYGAAMGAFISVFLVKRLPWKLLSLVLLISLIGVDLISILPRTADVLIGLRFLDGLIGGMLVGAGLAVIARTSMPDRAFGMLLVVQYGLGGFGIMFLPGLVPIYGAKVLFLALASFSVVTLLMLGFLPAYPTKKQVIMEVSEKAAKVKLWPLVVTLTAIFLFQASNMAMSAFMIGLGRHFGLTLDFIGPTLGEASWVGASGAVLVIMLATRFGRFWPLMAAIALSVIGTWAFHRSDLQMVYLLANFGTAVTWAFVIPYLFGMCSEFDKAGQMAALGGFFSKMGLATGPALGAFLLTHQNYGLLINLATIGLCGSMVAALFAALSIDRRKRRLLAV